MTDQHDRDADPANDRNETEDERHDRKWGELLQELRVMQTGAQLAAGFLLTLPFTKPFNELDDVQLTMYLTLVVLAGLTTVLVMTPVSVHRRLSGKHVKERLVTAAHRITKAVLGCISLLVIGMITFIFDVVVSRPLAFTVGGTVSVLALLLLVALPFRLVQRDE